MNHRIFSFVIFSLLVVQSLSAKINWLEKEYDFGTIQETEGKKPGAVRFVNDGPDAVIINEIIPGCGCTAVEFPKNEILPGDTAVISFTYNPTGRPGVFKKSMKVYWGDPGNYDKILIKGTVIGSPETLSNRYPFEKDNFRYENNTVLAGEVKKDEKKTKFITFYNNRNEGVRIKPGKIAGVNWLGVPEDVSPGVEGVIRFIYIPAEDKDAYGKMEYRLPVEIVEVRENEIKTDTIFFKLRGEVLPGNEIFEPEEGNGLGRIEAPDKILDLGSLSPGKPHEFEFFIINRGSGPLSLKNIYSDFEEIEITDYPKLLNAGEKKSIKGNLKLKGDFKGPFRLNINILCDDPLHPVSSIDLSGIVTDL